MQPPQARPTTPPPYVGSLRWRREPAATELLGLPPVALLEATPVTLLHALLDRGDRVLVAGDEPDPADPGAQHHQHRPREAAPHGGGPHRPADQRGGEERPECLVTHPAVPQLGSGVPLRRRHRQQGRRGGGDQVLDEWRGGTQRAPPPPPAGGRVPPPSAP